MSTQHCFLPPIVLPPQLSVLHVMMLAHEPCLFEAEFLIKAAENGLPRQNENDEKRWTIDNRICICNDGNYDTSGRLILGFSLGGPGFWQ